MTKEQVLIKLTTLCAKSEHCKDDMRKKMMRWEVPVNEQEEILEYLVREQYIDEERYARFFIEDKIQFNKWGKRKVAQALYMKRIPKDVYAHLLEEVEDEQYEEILLPLLQIKQKSVTGKSDYEIKQKLIRFAMQRGFSYEQIEKCLIKLETKK